MLYSSRLLAFLMLLVPLSGCKNLYGDFSHRTSTAYLLYDAERDIDLLEFDRAILNLKVVLNREPRSSKARYLYSVAHAGRAGLRVVQIFELLSSSTSGSIFEILASSFDTISDDDLTDFRIAIHYLESVGATPDQRDDEENFYALFLYLGRIGAIINRYAYDANNLLLSTTFSACHTIEAKAAIKTGIPDNAIDVIMTTLPRVIDTANAISASGGTQIIDTSAIAVLGALPYDPIPCSAGSNNVKCKGVRTFINNDSTGFGLGTGTGFPTILPPGDEGDLCPFVTP